MNCPICTRELEIHVARTMVRCACGADLISNGRILTEMVICTWVVATLASFFVMQFVTDDAWAWFVGGDVLFATMAYVFAFQFWRVRVARS